MDDLNEQVSSRYNQAGGKCELKEEEDADCDRYRQRKRRSMNNREALYHKEVHVWTRYQEPREYMIRI
jgi:hypothetical protein